MNKVSFNNISSKGVRISDHLGNVRAVIQDTKTGVSTSNSNTVDYFTANVVNATDYYAFGSPMVGRTFSAPITTPSGTSTIPYSFGFNGQLKDDEVYGEGNLNTAQFWEYDTRLGRRWNLDPKPTTGVSDYACFYDNPIMNNDVNGDVPGGAMLGGATRGATTMVQYITNKEVRQKVNQQVQNATRQLVNGGKAFLKDAAYRAGLVNGVQEFGFNVYSSDGVNSRAYGEMKGKARHVENLDINGMFPDGASDNVSSKILDKVKSFGVLDELGKVKLLDKVLNADVKNVADVMVKSTEVAEKTANILEKIDKAKATKTEKPHDTLTLTYNKDGSYSHSTYKDNYSNKIDTVKTTKKQ